MIASLGFSDTTNGNYYVSVSSIQSTVRYQPITLIEFHIEFFEWLDIIFPPNWFYQIIIYEVTRKIRHYIRQPKPRSNIKARIYK